jgi:autotransporter-associated beta strand protein
MAHAAPVAKSGAGLMVLSGANTFSGSTTISDGTLQIGNGGGSGSLAPVSSILNKGTLAFSRTNTVTQGADFGPISGSGGVSQLGSGTVHLVGVNGYTGGTRVESGILSIDTAFLADSADVHLSSGTELNLAFGGTDTIQDLYFNGVPQAVGTWGANGSAAVNQSDFFSGSGILNVAGSVPVAPTASFSADPTSGEAPVTVTFTDTSSGTITNRFWDFGDGVTSSTTSTLVMHTYTNAGTFSVELLVSGSLGSSTNTQTDLIDVNQAAPPPPEYAGDVFTLSNGEATIHFTTVAGYQYGAIYKDAMTNATWQPLIFDPDYPLPEGWSAIATNGTAMITDTNAVSHPRRFYRLRSQNPTP